MHKFLCIILLQLSKLIHTLFSLLHCIFPYLLSTFLCIYIHFTILRSTMMGNQVVTEACGLINEPND